MIYFILGPIILGVILMMLGAHKDDERIIGAGGLLLVLGSMACIVR